MSDCTLCGDTGEIPETKVVPCPLCQPKPKGTGATALQTAVDEARADERRQVINYLHAIGGMRGVAQEIAELKHYEVSDPS